MVAFLRIVEDAVCVFASMHTYKHVCTHAVNTLSYIVCMCGDYTMPMFVVGHVLMTINSQDAMSLLTHCVHTTL